MREFEKMLLNNPKSLEAAYGRVRALEALTEEDIERSQVLLLIEAHEELMQNRGMEMDDNQFTVTANTCLGHLKSLGESR